MIGMILGERYEIIEEVGSGGMAVVYKARCKLLNRFVAVKVLRKELAGDEDLLVRFKHESQAAARLSHPNIVSVYDVGAYEGLDYIVMEYVDGRTLKDYMVSNGILPWKEACGFAVQILSALEHAHKNGIIHRDIKPHNILITSERILKVTDFGIARASTSATLTLSGSTLGSVHYLSPEQARGGYTDARTDIYSLGIVMYEMLAGRLPFDGESPVAVAIMQIQNAPPPLKDFNVSVPLALDSAVMKAMKKDQEARYQSTTEMIDDLRAIVQKPDVTIESKEISPGGTRRMDAINPPPEPDPLVDDEKEESILDIKPEPYRPRKKRIEERVNPLISDTEDEKVGGKRTAIALGVVVAIIIASIVGFATWLVLFPNNNARPIEVPSVVGMTYDAAVAQFKDTPYEIIIKEKKYDGTKEKDVILSQDPGAGTPLEQSSVQINVVVNSGIRTFNIDNYRGQSQQQAEKELTDMGLKVTVEARPDNNVAQGFVVDTNPIAGSLVKTGDAVTIYVSQGGSSMVTVPRLVGYKLTEAKKRITDNKLTVGTTDYKDSSEPADTVIMQSISAGDTVDAYTQIDLLLSTGRNETQEPTDSPTPTTPVEKTKEIAIPIPQSKPSTLVKVTQDGKTIHEDRHNKEEISVPIRIKGSGSVHVEIFFDGISQGISVQKL